MTFRAAHRLLALALGAVLGGTTLLTAPAAHPAPGSAQSDAVRVAQEPDETPDPEPEADALAVRIDSLTPSAVPRRGRVTVTGTVTNTSEELWQNLQASLVVSPEPLRTRAALAEAAASDPDLVIGRRLLDDGQFVNVGTLAAGATAPFRLSIPRRELPISGAPGVYWLSVHVLGTDTDGNRDDIADGRARTFLPLVPAAPRTERTPVTTSLVVPLREQVLRRAGGTIAETASWDELLDDDGRLARLLEFAEATAPAPLTWLVDPAVLDAVARLAANNPGFDTGPSEETPSGGTGGPDPSPSTPTDETGSGSGGEAGADGTAPRTPDPETVRRAELAGTWLERFREAVADVPLLTLPYADPDVAAAWRHGRLDLVADAVAQSGIALTDLGFRAAPVTVAPLDGLLPGQALGPLGDLLAETAEDATVLLSDAAAPEATSSTIRAADHRVVLSDAAAGSGGPAPGDPHDSLAIRQRVLAEAALRVEGVGADQPPSDATPEEAAAVGGTGRPLVVQLPDDWDPGTGDAGDFLGGLDVDWLDLSALRTAVTDRGRDEDYPTDLAYPRSARRAELPARNLETAADLREAGRTLASLLMLNDTVDTEIDRAALSAASAQARELPTTPVSLARATAATVGELLDSIRVEGPEFVTMSSGEGHFAVTVVNDLDEPVRVAVLSTTDDDELTISAPAPLELTGGARVSLRLGARSSGFGVSEVRLTPATADGSLLPNTTTINVRRSQVGVVIWVVMGLGAAVLVVALVVRVVRRRREAEPDPEPSA